MFANAGITAGPGFLTVEGKRDPAGAIENIPFELWQRVIATNLSAVFATLRSAVPHMKRQNGGALIATTSVAGLRPSSVVGTPYMIAKAACAHLVRQAALELARFGIRVNAIAPGPFLRRSRRPACAPSGSAPASPSRRHARRDPGLALFLASLRPVRDRAAISGGRRRAARARGLGAFSGKWEPVFRPKMRQRSEEKNSATQKHASVAGAQTVDRACTLLKEIARHGASGARCSILRKLRVEPADRAPHPAVARFARLHPQDPATRRYQLGVGLFASAWRRPSGRRPAGAAQPARRWRRRPAIRLISGPARGRGALPRARRRPVADPHLSP